MSQSSISSVAVTAQFVELTTIEGVPVYVRYAAIQRIEDASGPEGNRSRLVFCGASYPHHDSLIVEESAEDILDVIEDRS